MRRALLVITLLLALAPTASAATTKAAYIKKADHICKAGNAAVAPYNSKLSQVNMNTASGIAQAVKLLNSGFKIENADYSELVALPKPPAYKAVLTHLLSALGSEITDTKKLIGALNTLDTAAINKDENAIDLAKASYKGLAEGIGFHYCGTH